MSDGNQLNVPLHIRYQAAWQEINARIQSRQYILGTYMTGVVVVLILGLIPTGNSYLIVEEWNMLPVILLPILTYSVALWSQHNDAIIGLLSAFCQKLERMDNLEQYDERPSWHDTRSGAIDEALAYRRNSDRAFNIIAFISTLPCLIFIINHVCKWNWISFIENFKPIIIPIIALVLGILAIEKIYSNAKLRANIKNTLEFEKDENEKYKWRYKKTP